TIVGTGFDHYRCRRDRRNHRASRERLHQSLLSRQSGLLYRRLSGSRYRVKSELDARARVRPAPDLPLLKRLAAVGMRLVDGNDLAFLAVGALDALRRQPAGPDFIARNQLVQPHNLSALVIVPHAGSGDA